jgi:sterol desaturase/sphingolipid hydroxylase (fatty acid hydroxylase superfamily)
MLDKINSLAEGHGALRTGHGLVSGIVALCLGILCLLGVVAFHYPQYLTTPELRKSYNVEVIRIVMLVALTVAGGLSVTNIIFGRARWLSSIAFLLVVVTAFFGGHKVPVNDFPDHTPYIGLDWFILDLLGSSLLFIFIEKLFPHRKTQPIFRPEWQTDFKHFIVNHMLIGFMLLAVNLAIHKVFGWAVRNAVQSWIQALPFAIELFLCILVADLVQYWTHRAYHETGLWRLHAVHHSAKHMDWMAGSRQHVFEILITRILVLAPIYVLGFSKEVIDAYIVVVGFQAVFNHCNVNVRLGPLRYIIVTPNFHHWHHSQDKEALDTNYAAHFAFLDYLFGTAAKSDKIWPQEYGVLGDYVPNGFWAQVKFPFTWKG